MRGKVKPLIESLYQRIEVFSKESGIWIGSEELQNILCDTTDTWEQICIGVDKVLGIIFSVYLNKVTGRKSLILRITYPDMTSNATAENQVPFLYQLLRYCTRDKRSDDYFLDYIIENIVIHFMSHSDNKTQMDLKNIRSNYFSNIDKFDLKIYLIKESTDE